MVLIEGCSSVRMDEGGIEPFKQGGGDSALCLYRPLHKYQKCDGGTSLTAFDKSRATPFVFI